MRDDMQQAVGDHVKPAVSVIVTLTVPLARPIECLRSWTTGQQGAPPIELVVVSDGARPELDDAVAGMLRAGDRILPCDGNQIAQYDMGARLARGRWLLFTEPHVEASPDCVAQLLAHVQRAGLDGACVRTLREWDPSPVARMESRMYQENPSGWTIPGDWRTFTKRGVLIERAAYEDAGGLDAGRPRFADHMLSAALRDRGHRVGYAPEATIHHQDAHDLRELLRYVWDFRREAEDTPEPAPAAVVVDALRHAWPKWRDRGWRRVAAPLLGHVIAERVPARLGTAARCARPAVRAALALMQFHSSRQDDDRAYAAFERLWQATGDLSIAASGPASRAGFHDTETWQGTEFRWTRPVAVIPDPGAGDVTIDLVPIRPLAVGEVLAYRGDRRLRQRPAPAEQLRFADDRPRASGPITLVCPPLPRAPGEHRDLGLPVVRVSG